MERAKHSPAGDRSFAVSVLAHLAGAVALVAAVAAAFWGLGQMQTPGDPVISEPDPSPTEVAAPADEPEEEPEPTESVEPEPADEPDPVDEDESDTADDEPDPADEDDEPSDDRAVEPSSVSIQVLDAAGDGGTRASFAADRLSGDGYRVVAENQAFRNYERTTVFYSEGQETAARQIADEYGYAVVEPKPDNLSASVDVHVVIGQDHPTG